MTAPTRPTVKKGIEMKEHEDKDVEKKSTDDVDFDDVIVSDPDDDPELDPEEGNGDGGNEPDGGKEAEGVEAESKSDDGEEGPADKEGAKTLDMDDDTRLEIEVDGKVQPALLKELKEAFINKAKWTKENTQKSMEIADQRKELEKQMASVKAYSALVQRVKSDPALVKQLNEYFGEDKTAIAALDAAVKADPKTLANEYEKTISDLRQQIAIREQEDRFKEARNDCMKKYQLSSSDMDEIDRLIFNEFKESKIALNHEKAYRIWRADKLIEAEGEKKTKPKPPEQSQGKVVQSDKLRPKKRSAISSHYETTEKDFEDIFK